MPYELVIFPNGTASVRPQDAQSSAEAMHSSIGPWEEANLLYTDQSNLAQKLILPDSEPLVLYDVGMGIAANALAAFQCALRTPATLRRELKVISFEKDTEGLRTALRHSAHFPFFTGFDSALTQLLNGSHWSDSANKLTWELRPGDFAELPLGNPEPEVIFYDFYSPKSQDAVLWGPRSFERLYQSCAMRRGAGKETSLYTYSSATAVRAAMLLAGFNVGTGTPTSAKKETTVACTNSNSLIQPLDSTWLKKLERTHKPLPDGWPRIFEHPQFAAMVKVKVSL